MDMIARMDSVTQRVLSQEYNLGPITAVERLGGTRNVNYLLITSTGKYVARQRNPAYCAPDRMQFDHDALEFLKSQGAAVVEAMTTTRGWRICLNGSAIWEVSPYVEGKHYEEGSPRQAAQLGYALGVLHRAGALFPDRYEKESVRGETDPDLLLTHAAQLQKECPEAEPELDRYSLWIQAAAAILPNEAYVALPCTLVHGDIQPANILMREDGVAAFVDFDWCAWRPRVYDLACAFLFCCTTHSEPFDGEDIYSITQEPVFDRACISAFLKGYQLVSGEVAPKEVAAINAQIALTWCHCRLAGAFKVPASERMAFLARGPHDLHKLQV